MPTPTYDLIASNVLTSSASSVEFTSIGSGYRDLVLVTNALMNTTGSTLFLQFNNDTAGNYYQVYAWGNGSTASSSTDSAATSAQFGKNSCPTTGSYLNIAQIMDYSATDKHKTVLFRDNLSDGNVEMSAARWASTSAITSLKIITISSRAFKVGSSFYLYGIVS